jgi:hypothetical protein
LLDYWVGLDFCWINGLDWIFVVLLDWIGFFQFNIQSNNPTKNPKIQLFWIFGVEFGWMFNHPSNSKSTKKLTS